MNNNKEMLDGVSTNSTKEVTTPSSNSQSISAVIKNSGEITGYELSNGQRISKEEGVKMAKDGNIAGVSVSVSKKGEEYLRSLPDQNESNNLSSLPTISD
ncbi:DUF3892 domain-containing protein [Clostridium botulinum]|uniref:DUF3892 domain-containing protein n=2 Tax=Clostridium TaxID=1485 RepID=B2TKS7_CLOBB|nr:MULTISPECIES: DUF3892 domain-containing protein [Clostridium]ACD23443.1 conserved hypothetical protein [Clostridium botulinum B str. Eklund 17B (NRP)]AIY79174.1 hypothetical protein U728_3147 [Clostridium botulinum 202F]KAI3346397.1 DUF3892 domain-containing protein [Clostridium botulinum]KFX54213.1 hypothetical protein KU40_15685 [Clostridium botulinum]KON13090.1 hypothetical protein ACP50_14395 [Clostridium botulinum]